MRMKKRPPRQGRTAAYFIQSCLLVFTRKDIQDNAQGQHAHDALLTKTTDQRGDARHDISCATKERNFCAKQDGGNDAQGNQQNRNLGQSANRLGS